MLFNDASYLVPALIVVGIMLLVGFPVHEFSHAFAAYRLGDSTARWQGRLSLDPRRHFDPLGGLMLVVSAVASSFFIGWAKPTPVNPMNLQGGRRGEALVAASGPLSNLILAAIVAIPVRIVWANPALLDNRLAIFMFDLGFLWVVINTSLFIFNLLPIPPLDGWRVLLGLVDSRTAWTLRQFEQYAIFLLVLIVVFGGRIIGPIIGFFLDLLIPGTFFVPLST
ncbi:MAG: site-2 protease family protein [Candidatus Limnocylindrales bacterium]